MGATTGENVMAILPKRVKKKRQVTCSNDLDPDHELTELEAEEYSIRRGCHLSLNRLRMSRMNNPPCNGPKFLKIDGWHVRYTPRLLDEYIDARLPCVVDPADRISAAAS